MISNVLDIILVFDNSFWEEHQVLIVIRVSEYLFSGIFDKIIVFWCLFLCIFWVFQGVMDYQKTECRCKCSNIFWCDWHVFISNEHILVDLDFFFSILTLFPVLYETPVFLRIVFACLRFQKICLQIWFPIDFWIFLDIIAQIPFLVPHVKDVI